MRTELLGPRVTQGAADENGKEMRPTFSRYCAVLVKDGGSWEVTAFRSLPQVKSKLTRADMH